MPGNIQACGLTYSAGYSGGIPPVPLAATIWLTCPFPLLSLKWHGNWQDAKLVFPSLWFAGISGTVAAAITAAPASGVGGQAAGVLLVGE
jgi:hypothetical protein